MELSKRHYVLEGNDQVKCNYFLFSNFIVINLLYIIKCLNLVH